MDRFPTLKDLEKKLFQLRSLNKEEIAFQLFPYFLGEVLSRYFRIEIEGLENIPESGAGIIAPNHSGYSGFDAFLLGHQIAKHTQRQPKTLTHKLWFASQTTGTIMEKMGFVEATTKNGLEQVKNGELMVIFPEGEYGNFKPTTKRYHLQKFKRGFIRMAIRSQAPIIPTLIVGAEETHINLARLKITKYLVGKGMVLPLPLNIVPLPVKWKLRFMKPIYLPYTIEQADDSELVHELADEIREEMQAQLTKDVASRVSVFR